MTTTELSKIFTEITGNYSNKFKDLNVVLRDNLHNASYEVIFSWKNKNDTKYFKSEIVYELLNSNDNIRLIVDYCCDILDKEAKVLEYRSDFEDLIGE